MGAEAWAAKGRRDYGQEVEGGEGGKEREGERGKEGQWEVRGNAIKQTGRCKNDSVPKLSKSFKFTLRRERG